jgi:hypothetical protein
MTDNQKQFIKERFFKNEEYAGWSSIADTLLEKGECIIAGTDKLWYGGIGNFIKISTAEGMVGCSVLTFDKETFLKSAWFQEYKKAYLDNLTVKIEDLKATYEEIRSIHRGNPKMFEDENQPIIKP